MKHLLSVIAITALTSVAAIAADSAPALEYGVHGGINFGTTSNAAPAGETYGSETGVVAGVVVQYPLMDYVSDAPTSSVVQQILPANPPESAVPLL